MNLQNIDKNQLKAIIREIMIEDVSLFKSIIKDLLVDNQVIISEEQLKRREKLEKMIDDDFDQYDEVFKSLA